MLNQQRGFFIRNADGIHRHEAKKTDLTRGRILNDLPGKRAGNGAQKAGPVKKAPASMGGVGLKLVFINVSNF